MALTTRCPHCGTAFKVVPDQLKVRDGLVRCGVCAGVFDGRATLVAEIPTLQAEPPAQVAAVPPLPESEPARAAAAPADVLRPRPRSQPQPEHPQFQPHAQLIGPRAEPRWAAPSTTWTPAADTRPATAPEVLRGRHHALRRTDPVLRGDPLPEGDRSAAFHHDTACAATDAYDDRTEEAAAHAVPGESRMRYVDDYHSGRTPPEFLDEAHAQRRAHHGRLWGWACLVAAVILVGLSAHVYRVQLATQLPALRPLLQWMCTPFQCTVGYERRIERISILSSSLRPPPGGASAPGQQDLVLTAVLRNRFNAPQHWPALALELKDFSDSVMVRKVLLPRDYLPADVLAQPFGPNAERKIVLPLRVRDVQVNGYQLDRFFP